MFRGGAALVAEGVGELSAESRVVLGSWGGLLQRAESRYAREGVKTDDLAGVIGWLVDRGEMKPGHEAGTSSHPDVDHAAMNVELADEDTLRARNLVRVPAGHT